MLSIFHVTSQRTEVSNGCILGKNWNTGFNAS